MVSCHCEGESPKQSSFYQLKKVGNRLSIKVRNVQFCERKYPHIGTFCPNICTQKRIGRLKSTDIIIWWTEVHLTFEIIKYTVKISQNYCCSTNRLSCAKNILAGLFIFLFHKTSTF